MMDEESRYKIGPATKYAQDFVKRTQRDRPSVSVLDVLEYLAYNTKPIDRQKRAEILRENELMKLNNQQMDFVNFVLDLYVKHGFKELDSDKLGTLLEMKYSSLTDAMLKLGLQPEDMRTFYLGMQEELYNGQKVVNFKIENHFHESVNQVVNIEPPKE